MEEVGYVIIVKKVLFEFVLSLIFVIGGVIEFWEMSKFLFV